MSSPNAILSPDWPTTMFHSDGVRTCRVETPADFDRLLGQGWHPNVQPPPPEPEPPMSQEEKDALRADYVEGLGDQVDSQSVTLQKLEERLSGLERGATSSTAVNLKADIVGLELLAATDARVEQLTGRVAVLEDSIKNARAFFDQVERRQTVLEGRQKGENKR